VSGDASLSDECVAVGRGKGSSSRKSGPEESVAAGNYMKEYASVCKYVCTYVHM